jgi:hypothetical protein
MNRVSRRTAERIRRLANSSKVTKETPQSDFGRRHQEYAEAKFLSALMKESPDTVWRIYKRQF